MLLVKTDLQDNPIKISDASYVQVKKDIDLRPTSYDVNNVASFSLMIPVADNITTFSATIVSNETESWDIIYRSTLTGNVEVYNILDLSDVVLRTATNYKSLPFGVTFCPKYINGEPILDDNFEPKSFGTLFIQYTIDSVLYNVELDINSLIVDYNLHTPEQLDVFNLKVDNDMYEAFKDTPIRQPYKDRKILNQKRRELLMRQNTIKTFQGAYKSLLSVLDFFGYGDLLSIREIWANADKVVTTDVTNEVLDFIDNRLAVFTKTNNIQLVYQINATDGTFDDRGIPFYINVLIDTELVLYKMFLIRDILEDDYLPVNVKITDIIGEYTQPVITNLGSWDNPTHCINIQGSGTKDDNYLKIEQSDLVISNRFVLTNEGVFLDYNPNTDTRDRSQYVLGVNSYKQLVAYFLEDGRQKILSSEWYYTTNIAFDVETKTVFTLKKNSDVDGQVELIGIDISTNVVSKSIVFIEEPNNLTFHDGLLYTINGDNLYTIDPSTTNVVLLGAIGWDNAPTGDIDITIDTNTEDVFVVSGNKLHVLNLSDLVNTKRLEFDIDNITGATIVYDKESNLSDRLIISNNTTVYNSSIHEISISEINDAVNQFGEQTIVVTQTDFKDLPVVIKDLAYYGFDHFDEPTQPNLVQTEDVIYAIELGGNNEFTLLDDSLSRTILNSNISIQNNSYVDIENNLIYSINSSQEVEVYDLPTQTLQSTHATTGLPNVLFSDVGFYDNKLFVVESFMYHIDLTDFSVHQYSLDLNLEWAADENAKIWIDGLLGIVYFSTFDEIYYHHFDTVSLTMSSKTYVDATETITALSGKNVNGGTVLYFVDDNDKLNTLEIPSEVFTNIYSYAQSVFSLNLGVVVTFRPDKAFCYDNTDYLLIDSEVFEDVDENDKTIQPYEDYKMLNNFHSLDVALLKMEIGFEPEEYNLFNVKLFNTADLQTPLPMAVWETGWLNISNLAPEMILGLLKIGEYSVRWCLQDKHGGHTILQKKFTVTTTAPDFSLCLIDRTSINPYTKEYQYNKNRIFDLDIHNRQTFHRGDIVHQRDIVNSSDILFQAAQDTTLGAQENSIATDPLAQITNLGLEGNIGANPFENYTVLWGTFPFSEGYPYFTYTAIDLDINTYSLVNQTSPIGIHVKNLMHKSPDAYMRETHMGQFSQTPMIDICDSRMDDYGYTYPRWYIDVLGDGLNGTKTFTIRLLGLEAIFSLNYNSGTQTENEFVKTAVNWLNEKDDTLFNMFTFTLEYVNIDDITTEVMIRATFRFKAYLSEWFVFDTVLNVISNDYQSFGSLQGFARTILDLSVLSGTLEVIGVEESILGLELFQTKHLLYEDILTYTDAQDLATKLRLIATENNFDLEVIVSVGETDEVHLITKDNLIIKHPTLGVQTIKCIGLEGSVLNVVPVGSFVQMGQPFYAFVNTYSRNTNAFIVWTLTDSLTGDVEVVQYSIVFRFMMFKTGTFDLTVSITDRNGTHTHTKKGFVTIDKIPEKIGLPVIEPIPLRIVEKTELATINYSMLLNGIDEYFEAPINPIYDLEWTDPMSISARFKKTSDLSPFHAISKWVTDRGFFFTVTSNGRLRFELSTGLGIDTRSIDVYSDIGSVLNDVHNHMLVTYDGSGLVSGVNMYLNNILLPKTTFGLVCITSDTIINTTPLRMGTLVSVGQFGAGFYDNARMWNIELGVDDIELEYNDGKILDTPVKPNNIIVDCKMGNNGFFDGSNWQLLDESRNVNFFKGINLEEASRSTDVNNQ